MRVSERIVELVPGAVYENRFGTVAVRRDADTYEITTFRNYYYYADHRRPHRVEFGETVQATSPGATSRSTRWPGAARRARRWGLSIRSTVGAISRRRLSGWSATPRGAVRRGRPPDGWLLRLRRHSGFTIEPATLHAIAARS